MYLAPIERHVPKSPLPRRDHAIRAELTQVPARRLELEQEQDVRFRRIAQIQQELDEIKRLLKQIAKDS